MSKPFMTICPRNNSYMSCNLQGIPLKVISDKGVEISPHISFHESELDSGVKIFHNNSGQCDKFSVDILLNEKDTVLATKDYSDFSWQDDLDEFDAIIYSHNYFRNGKYTSDTQLGKKVKVIDLLDKYIRTGEPFFITTRAVGINSNDLWFVTENKSRSQSYDDGYVVWSLTFTKDVSYSFSKFVGQSKGVTNALKTYKKNLAKAQKQAKAQKLAKQKKTAKYKLKHKCKYTSLKYSKKRKTVTCVKYMQKILINKGFLKNYKENKDGWYGKVTKNAVKSFQKKYKKKYKLKVTGNVDKKTFNALCK